MKASSMQDQLTPNTAGWLAAVLAKCVADTESGEVLHDPHPSKAGLVAVDSYFYLFPKDRK